MQLSIVYNTVITIGGNPQLYRSNSFFNTTLAAAHKRRAKRIFPAATEQTWRTTKASSDVWLIASFHIWPFKENLGQPK